MQDELVRETIITPRAYVGPLLPSSFCGVTNTLPGPVPQFPVAGEFSRRKQAFPLRTLDGAAQDKSYNHEGILEPFYCRINSEQIFPSLI